MQQRQYDVALNALEAAKQYVELKKSKGEQINAAAITKSAIKDGWVPKKEDLFEKDIVVDKKSQEEVIKEKEEKQKAHKALQENPVWLKIKQKIKAEFDLEIWEKWFSGLEVFSIKDSKIIISAPNKFVRDWIIRELSDDIKGVVHSLYPDLRTVSFSCS